MKKARPAPGAAIFGLLIFFGSLACALVAVRHGGGLAHLEDTFLGLGMGVFGSLASFALGSVSLSRGESPLMGTLTLLAPLIFFALCGARVFPI